MSEISIETVGIIGLGKMGGPLAGHLARGGFSVLGYDVDVGRIDVVVGPDRAQLGAGRDLAEEQADALQGRLVQVVGGRADAVLGHDDVIAASSPSRQVDSTHTLD